MLIFILRGFVLGFHSISPRLRTDRVGRSATTLHFLEYACYLFSILIPTLSQFVRCALSLYHVNQACGQYFIQIAEYSRYNSGVPTAKRFQNLLRDAQQSVVLDRVNICRAFRKVGKVFEEYRLCAYCW